MEFLFVPSLALFRCGIFQNSSTHGRLKCVASVWVSWACVCPKKYHFWLPPSWCSECLESTETVKITMCTNSAVCRKTSIIICSYFIATWPSMTPNVVRRTFVHTTRKWLTRSEPGKREFRPRPHPQPPTKGLSVQTIAGARLTATL